MLAVVKIGGHQEIVEVGEVLEVDKLLAEVGKTVNFETLLVSEPNGEKFQVGDPFISGTVVEAKVLEHGRGDKIRVFKMKKRKRYRKTQGHRQDYTLIEITKIGAGKVAAVPKKTEEKAEKKPVAKKTTPKKVETKAKKA